MQNIIEDTIKEFIGHENTVFVFATQMAADLWADRATLVCGVDSVAVERFIAWDDFKGKSITSKQDGLSTVPSVMRQIFALNLIKQNKSQTIIKNLINPSYAKTSEVFADWIASILPSLALWKKHFEKAGQTPDGEDKDLLELHRLYKEFLDKNKFFDPAWETPPFKDDGRKYIIFFPEILSDYTEYKELLDQSQTINCIHFPQKALPDLKNEESLLPVDFYDNSRSELRAMALSLRQVHEKQNIDWNDMVISVPDMDSYGPYITRELDIYQIPHVVRFAKPLDSTGTGNLFQQISNCISSNFSFNSLRDLLLNQELPWKNQEAQNRLINFGQNNNCICSFSYQGKALDIWEESFRTAPGETLTFNFYKLLKQSLTQIVKSKTFKEIQKNYFTFRETFFDMEQCTPYADKIISRCISELAGLIDLEEAYPQECKTDCPYSFFTKILSSTKYLEQTDNLGVRVIPYKACAQAPFAYQVIVDSSQSSLSVIYKNLAFLRENKRRMIFNGQEDPNVTKNFIFLYTMNSLEIPPKFFAAKKTFTGYSQTCAYLHENDYSEPDKNTPPEYDDPYVTEKLWFTQKGFENIKDFPITITQTSMNGLDFWIKNQPLSEECEHKDVSIIRQAVSNYGINNDGKIKISATDLKYYNSCPRQWLFKYITDLKEPDNEAQLIDSFAVGNLKHKIFELFFTQLKNRGLRIQVEQDGLSQEYSDILDESVTQAITCLTKHDNKDWGNSFLATQILLTIREALFKEIKTSIENFSIIFQDCTVAYIEQKLSFDEGDLAFNGKFDILLADDDANYLIDFKNSEGAVPKNLYPDEEDSSVVPDFQMPMYLYLLEKNNLKTTNCGFYAIKEQKLIIVTGDEIYKRIKAVSPRAKAPPEEKIIEQLFEEFHKNTADFASSIKNAVFPVNNLKQDFDCCNACNYRAVCRRVFNVSGQNQ